METVAARVTSRWRRRPRRSTPRVWRRGSRTLQLMLAVGVLAIAVCMLSAVSASAVILRAGNAPVSYEPLPNAPGAAPKGSKGGAKPTSSKLVEFHGGPVMASNTNYALYWAPGGPSQFPAGYESGIDRYFEDIAHDSGGGASIDSVLNQYGANYNSHFGGAIVDTDPYPASGCSEAAICFTEEQLRAEIRKFVEAQKLPTDLQHEYFLLTPAGVESCLEAIGHKCSAGTKHSVYCAYHGDIAVSGGVIVYANIPFMLGTNCNTGEEHPNNAASDATLAGGMVHEHAESITDPELNAWHDANGEEVADKCRTFKVVSEFGPPLGKAPDGSNYNQVINGDLYWYQQVWSNEGGACEQRALQAPVLTKLAPKNGPAAGGTSVTITGTSFAGSVGVHFGAAAAAQVTVNSSTSITAVSPAGSVGTVDVTITTAGGTSAITNKDHFKYKKPKKTKG
jgi:hypothetical protein